MKISLNTIAFLNDKWGSAPDPAADGAEALIDAIGAQLGEVKEAIAFGQKFAGVLIAKVVSCVDHPDADRLHVCMIDDGGKAEGVERNAQGLVQVVCGAPNVREGLLVAWLPPGSTVPSSFDNEPFVLGARELRGVVSNGMLASPKELGLSDNHEGILEIMLDSDEVVSPGMTFSEAYHLDGDIIVDIENKMFTHRPDCFGWLGVARELAGIQGEAYKSPDWYNPSPVLPGVEADELKLEVKNEIPDLVPRFSAVVLSGIKIGPSPTWLQVDLARAGLRPINNIVDYTNYFMLLTGQPLHAYDYDKVRALDQGDQATIVVRQPRDSDRLTLLNGKTIDPRQEAILIATATQPIGLGGVMGGASTEVSDETTNIILECASFDMYSIRRSSMAHGLFSDAVTRFNKGQSQLQTLAVLARVVDELRKNVGAKVASTLVDNVHLSDTTLTRASVHPQIKVSVDFVNQRLGLSLGGEEMATLLRNVEFSVEVAAESLAVTAPFWRTDIELREDIVEEIGRLYGFDQLPLVLPEKSIVPAHKDVMLGLKTRVRSVLAKAGANELLTYSFVHGNLLDKVGQDKALAFSLSNALSPDLQYYRLSLTPSLLDKVHSNVKAGYDRFALFEIGKAHVFGQMDPIEPDAPNEIDSLALVFAADAKAAKQYNGAAFFQAKKYWRDLLDSFAVTQHITLEPLEGADLYQNTWLEQLTKPYEPARSAVMRDSDGLVWGVVGEFRASVRKALKLPDYCAGLELDPLLLLKSAGKSTYRPLSRFPSLSQDICFKVATNVTYLELANLVGKQVEADKPKGSHASLSPVDIFQREDDADHKQITLRLTITNSDRTMTDAEITQLLDKVAEQAHQALSAERV